MARAVRIDASETACQPIGAIAIETEDATVLVTYTALAIC
jgi:hypothetical protein